jgi:hypothetical protein
MWIKDRGLLQCDTVIWQIRISVSEDSVASTFRAEEKTLEMEAAVSPETFMNIYQTTQLFRAALWSWSSLPPSVS